MARKSNKKVEPIDLTHPSKVAEQLATLQVGQALKLHGFRKPDVRKALSKSGAVVGLPINNIRDIALDGRTYQWTNITVAMARKRGGGVDDGRREIVRLT